MVVSVLPMSILIRYSQRQLSLAFAKLRHTAAQKRLSEEHGGPDYPRLDHYWRLYEAVYRNLEEDGPKRAWKMVDNCAERIEEMGNSASVESISEELEKMFSRERLVGFVGRMEGTLESRERPGGH